MNTVGYFEIQSDDPAKAVTFYTEIFDWKAEKDVTLPIEYYRIFNAGIQGGILKRPAKRPDMEQGTNAFTVSIQVADFDKTAEMIIQRGGVIALPKFAVVGKCWQGYFLDGDSNVFGIFQVDEKAS